MSSDRDRWVAIEHDFCDNPKILRVGAAGGWAHLRAIIYAARHRTDGFIPDEAVYQILHDDPVMDSEASSEAKPDLEASMVQAKLWHRVANGYQIHDYLKHQSTAESIREKRARAGRLGGLARAKQMSSKSKHSRLEAESEVEVNPPTPLNGKTAAGFTCMCGRTFQTERALALHIQNVHDGPPVPLDPAEINA